MQDGRAEEPLNPCGKRMPGPARLELRGLPQRPQREKGEDEDDCPTPEEEPIGNGQVTNSSDPMRDEVQGRTSSSASCRPRSSSSISKRPGAVAVKLIVPGEPGATSTIRS
jgi:hypothetical protein